jgi:hypothetical protein
MVNWMIDWLFNELLIHKTTSALPENKSKCNRVVCVCVNSKQQRTFFKTGVHHLITLKQLLPIHTYTRVSIHPCIHTRTREHFMHSTTTSLTYSITNTPISLPFHPSRIHQFSRSYMRISTLPPRHFTDFKAEVLGEKVCCVGLSGTP